MKKKRITYGVSGMMEYQVVVKIGKSSMKVLFSDGSVSAMGVNPATYTTDSFIVQQAIENSYEYKRGRIKTVNVIELDEEMRVERNKTKAEEDAMVVSKAEVKVEAEAEAKLAEETGGESEESEESEESSEAAVAPEGTEIEFSCNDDAKDYLEEKYGYIRSKLRTRDDIIKAGKAHGLEIIFV